MTYGWLWESVIDRHTDMLHQEGLALPSEAALLSSPEGKESASACPVPGCDAELADVAALQNHIFDAHRQVDLFLLVDGRVFTDTPVIIDWPVSHAEIFAVGMRGLEVNACLQVGTWGRSSQGRKLKGRKESVRHRVPFADLLDGAYPRQLRLDVRWGSQERHFEIYYNAPAPLAPAWSQSVHAVITAVQSDLNGLDWEQFRRQITSAPATERRYGEGLFEYLLGHHLEVQATRYRKESHRHLARSFSKLRPFDTPLAALAKALVAFRLGWFDALSSAPGVVRMKLIAEFFKPLQAVPAQAPAAPSQQDERPITASLLVDDFHHFLADAIEAHSNGRYDEVADRIAELHRSPLLPDNRVNGEKLLLLEARHSLATGNMRQARALYRELLDHRRFGVEAERFV